MIVFRCGQKAAKMGTMLRSASFAGQAVPMALPSVLAVLGRFGASLVVFVVRAEGPMGGKPGCDRPTGGNPRIPSPKYQNPARGGQRSFCAALMPDTWTTPVPITLVNSQAKLLPPPLRGGGFRESYPGAAPRLTSRLTPG